MFVVVVEFFVKVKMINKYLGDDYMVLVSFGYVCDLLLKDGSVDLDVDFVMKWEVVLELKKYVKVIKDVLVFDLNLIFVIDFDCEGEVIFWYLLEVLVLVLKKGVEVSCVIFNVIIKMVVIEVMVNLCQIDQLLVDVYLVCWVLDYLVGFNLLFVLWCKLLGVKLVGWVQLVVLWVIVDREMEIEVFKVCEYWLVYVKFVMLCGDQYDVILIVFGGKKLECFDLVMEKDVMLVVFVIVLCDLKVVSVMVKFVSWNLWLFFMILILQ